MDARRDRRAAVRAQGRQRPRRRPATSPSRWPRGCARTSPTCRAACRARGSCCSSTSRRCPPCSPAGCRRRPATAPSARSRPIGRRADACATCSSVGRRRRPGGALLRAPTSRSRCCATPAPTRSRSTPRCSTRAHYDALGEAVDAGMSLWLGVLPATDAAVSLDRARDAVRALWSALGFAGRQLARVGRRDAGLRAGRRGPALRAARARRCCATSAPRCATTPAESAAGRAAVDMSDASTR